MGSNVISTVNSRSRPGCAVHCTTDPTCKSLLYNTITRYCQLLSVQMSPVSDNGPQTSTGWRYYERKFDDVSTEVSAGVTTAEALTTQFTFNCGEWHQFSGHWYLLDPTRRTFNDAKLFCSNQSPTSYVVEVQTQEENNWLITLSATHCGAPNEYWLNGFDTDDSGSFTWIDSQNLTTYTNWYTAEPNSPAEQCIVITTGYLGVWNDIPCTEQKPVVCERNT
ncbi:C-type lectin-like [Crassostrea virginica]